MVPRLFWKPTKNAATFAENGLHMTTQKRWPRISREVLAANDVYTIDELAEKGFRIDPTIRRDFKTAARYAAFLRNQHRIVAIEKGD